MNAPVDALAVIDKAIADPNTAPRHAMPLRDVRAAVAELVEADKEFDAARAAYAEAVNNTDLSMHKAKRLRAVERASERRAVALRRIGGAA